MNVVRRFLSAVKGGRLAAAAPRSRQISLYVSDVNSDDLSAVSSGPTLPSAATRADFDRVVERYGLLDKFGEENMFGNIDDALDRARELIGAEPVPHPSQAQPEVARERK